MKCRGPLCPRTDVRSYMVGDCCPDHTPAAHAGRPEPHTRVDPRLTFAGLAVAAAARRTHPQLTCPGCRDHPSRHRANCPLGPRARFAMTPTGAIAGTQKRGPA